MGNSCRYQCVTSPCSTSSMLDSIGDQCLDGSNKGHVPPLISMDISHSQWTLVTLNDHQLLATCVHILIQPISVHGWFKVWFLEVRKVRGSVFSGSTQHQFEIGSAYQNLIEIKLCNSFIIPKWANTPPPPQSL